MPLPGKVCPGLAFSPLPAHLHKADAYVGFLPALALPCGHHGTADNWKALPLAQPLSKSWIHITSWTSVQPDCPHVHHNHRVGPGTAPLPKSPQGTAFSQAWESPVTPPPRPIPTFSQSQNAGGQAPSLLLALSSCTRLALPSGRCFCTVPWSVPGPAVCLSQHSLND